MAPEKLQPHFRRCKLRRWSVAADFIMSLAKLSIVELVKVTERGECLTRVTVCIPGVPPFTFMQPWFSTTSSNRSYHRVFNRLICQPSTRTVLKPNTNKERW